MEGPVCSLESACAQTSGRGVAAHKLFAGQHVLMESAQPQTHVPVWRGGVGPHVTKHSARKISV